MFLTEITYRLPYSYSPCHRFTVTFRSSWGFFFFYSFIFPFCYLLAGSTSERDKSRPSARQLASGHGSVMGHLWEYDIP
jgi:hypothetical protein